MTVKMLIGAAASFAVTAILCKVFIPVLRKVKLGQKILEIGPSWHKCKEGTPTMGGLFFTAAIFVSMAALVLPYCIKSGDWAIFVHFGFALANGATGFVDDYVKLFKKRNKGLSATQKLIIQFALAAAYLYSLTIVSPPATAIFGIETGFLWYVIMLVVIVYFVNCSNLTDGIDGLEGSVSAVICVLFVIIALRSGDTPLGVLAASAAGALIGYLIFNFHPARIFMGDTGSLFLGGLAVGMLMYIDAPLLIFLVGIVWLTEGISDILQVAFFKLTGKRIFKMCPIHHHFEMCGWSEVAIVGVFSLVTAVGCAAAYFIYI